MPAIRQSDCSRQEEGVGKSESKHTRAIAPSKAARRALLLTLTTS